MAKLLVEHAAPLNNHTIKYITQEVLEAQVGIESQFRTPSKVEQLSFLLRTTTFTVLFPQAKRLDAAAAAINASSSSSGGSTKKVGSGKKTSSKTPPLDMSGLVTIGGNSALALAVRHGSTSVVEFLLQQVRSGLEVRLKPSDGTGPHS